MAKTTEIPLSTFAAAAADVDLGSNNITNLADPVAAQDAATRQYVDDATGGALASTLFDAHTILKADADNTPLALTVGEDHLIGRVTGGTIAALTAAQVRTLLNIADGAQPGTVTSVGLTLPAELTVNGSPVTGSGTLAGSWADQNANLIFAGPVSGVASTPAFRALVADDIPSLDAAQIGSGSFDLARIPASLTGKDADHWDGYDFVPASLTTGEFLTYDGTDITNTSAIFEDGSGLIGINKTATLGAQLHVVSGDAARVGLTVSTAATPTADIAHFQNDGTDQATVSAAGDLWLAGDISVDGALDHAGSTIGFNGMTPVAQSTGWAVSNLTSDKVFDADSTTLDEIADVLGTLITYLLSRGDLAA